MGRYIGYARVSTNDQDLSLQINELKVVGCEPIFINKVSGAKSHRPCLAAYAARRSEATKKRGVGVIPVSF